MAPRTLTSIQPTGVGNLVGGVSPAPMDAGALRAACAQFATGVVVVTASADGQDFGGTVNSFTSLSLEPPQVIVCLARTSNTWSAIERSQTFAVNVLAADQLGTAQLFASKEVGKLSQVDSEPGVVGAPLLTGALSHLECTVADVIASGTHLLVIGRVVRVAHDAAKDPALFFRSQMFDGFSAAAPSADGLPIRRDQ
ncbi:flavin reductase family protein [Modestobacter lapidis]|nr:flavin reductase family protein [Modestobacter lapidis]